MCALKMSASLKHAGVFEGTHKGVLKVQTETRTLTPPHTTTPLHILRHTHAPLSQSERKDTGKGWEVLRSLEPRMTASCEPTSFSHCTTCTSLGSFVTSFGNSSYLGVLATWQRRVAPPTTNFAKTDMFPEFDEQSQTANVSHGFDAYEKVCFNTNRLQINQATTDRRTRRGTRRDGGRGRRRHNEAYPARAPVLVPRPEKRSRGGQYHHLRQTEALLAVKTVPRRKGYLSQNRFLAQCPSGSSDGALSDPMFAEATDGCGSSSTCLDLLWVVLPSSRCAPMCSEDGGGYLVGLPPGLETTRQDQSLSENICATAAQRRMAPAVPPEKDSNGRTLPSPLNPS